MLKTFKKTVFYEDDYKLFDKDGNEIVLVIICIIWIILFLIKELFDEELSIYLGMNIHLLV